MGRGARMRPARLAVKLLHIRSSLELTQEKMALVLGHSHVTREYVSGFELGTREPALPVLLQYARIAGVYVDVLIDDELDLPESLPAPSRHKAGIRTYPHKSKTGKKSSQH